LTHRLLPLLCAAVLLAGCAGDSGPAGPALEQTAAKLNSIESGILSVSVRIDPKDGDEFGYEIDGPIQLAANGKLPLADVRYRQFANGEEETVRLVLEEDGSGWVERGGARTELTQAQLDELRASGSLLGDEGLETLRFEQWIADPKLSDGPDGTDKVTGDLDVAAALNGLAALSGLLEQDVRLEQADRDQVAESVEESSFELLTGKDDRLLRKLALAFTFDSEVPEELREALGEESVGAAFSFELELDDVNQPVQIGD
jgi:hypothetical protein